MAVTGEKGLETGIISFFLCQSVEYNVREKLKLTQSMNFWRTRGHYLCFLFSHMANRPGTLGRPCQGSFLGSKVNAFSLDTFLWLHLFEH